MKKLLLLMVLFACPLMAQTVDFEWDPYTDADKIDGFMLFQSKQSGVYTEPATETIADPYATTVSTAQPKYGRFYWILTAFVDEPVDGIIQSDPSNEVTMIIKPKPPVLKSVVQTVFNVVSKPVTLLAGLFKNSEQLRIVK